LLDERKEVGDVRVRKPGVEVTLEERCKFLVRGKVRCVTKALNLTIERLRQPSVRTPVVGK